MIDRLPLSKKNIEACELDKGRKATLKVRREAPKQS